MDTAHTDYTILPLIGLQNRNHIWLEGHIVKINNRFLVIRDKEKYWRNILRVITSYMPGSIKRRKLEIHFNGQKHEVHTNKYGLLKLSIPADGSKKINHEDFKFYLYKKGKRYKIHLPEPFMYCFYMNGHYPVSIISDIDDTVLVTHTQNPVKKLRTLLIKNAYKRKAVREMRELYQHFADAGNSFFYISNSEANLFPMIRLFLEHQGLPIGPVFLKSFKKWKNLFKRKKKRERGYHKKEKIQLLFEVFPDMKFILIGDDSQQDPEIYSYFARNYPDRINRIFIRHAREEKIRKDRLQQRDKLLRKQGIQIMYFKNPGDIIQNIN